MQPESVVARLHWAYLQKYCTWVATFEPMCKCARVGLRGKRTNLRNSYTCFNRWPDFGTERPGPDHRWLSPPGNSREEGELGSSNTYCWFLKLGQCPNIQNKYSRVHCDASDFMQTSGSCLMPGWKRPRSRLQTGQLQPKSLKGLEKAVGRWRTCQQHRLGLRAIPPLLHGHRPHANRNKRQAVESSSDNTGAVWASASRAQPSTYTCWDVSVQPF